MSSDWIRSRANASSSNGSGLPPLMSFGCKARGSTRDGFGSSLTMTRCRSSSGLPSRFWHSPEVTISRFGRTMSSQSNAWFEPRVTRPSSKVPPQLARPPSVAHFSQEHPTRSGDGLLNAGREIWVVSLFRLLLHQRRQIRRSGNPSTGAIPTPPCVEMRSGAPGFPGRFTVHSMGGHWPACPLPNRNSWKVDDGLSRRYRSRRYEWDTAEPVVA